MDIGRALTFFTDEERWIEKTTIGALVILVSFLLSFAVVGVVGFFIVMGYGIRLMRNVRQGVRPVLPEWDQWADDLARGFKLFVVSLVWSLPAIIVSLPSLLGGFMMDSNSDGAAAIGLMLFLCGTCLTLVYALFLALVQPGYTIAFARDESIRSGLDFSAIWQWTRAHLSDVAVVAIVYVVGSMIISTVAFLVGLIACGIGILVTIPLGTLVVTYFQYHLYGQLPEGNLGTPTSRARTYAAEEDSFSTPPASTPPASTVVVSSPAPVESEVPPTIEDTDVSQSDSEGDTPASDTDDDPTFKP